MKLIIFIGVLSVSLNLYSQETTKNMLLANDLLARQGIATQYLKENNYDYKSGQAKAMHNILIEAFSKSAVVVMLDYKILDNSEDKQNIVSLIEGLNSILVLTPSWEEIVALEKNKLLAEERYMKRVPTLLENKK